MPRLSDITKAQVQDDLSRDFARWLSCLADTNLPSSASDVFLQRYPHSLGASLVRKAATTPGTTTDSAWAGPLLAIQPLVTAFVALARAASLLGRIPGLRMIPSETKVPIQTGDAGYAWVKQGDPKPVSKLAFSNGVMLGPTKATAIVVVTRDLVSLTVPGASKRYAIR